LKDPSGLFNSSLEGNVRRAIDIHEGEKVDEAALKDLIRAAVALNLKSKSKPAPKPKPRRASSKRADYLSHTPGDISSSSFRGFCERASPERSRRVGISDEPIFAGLKFSTAPCDIQTCARNFNQR
jgi:hypothetical protein